MTSLNFSKKQSDAVQSLIIESNQIRIKFRNSQIFYRYSADQTAIDTIQEKSDLVKKDPTNHSIGALINHLIKNQHLVLQPFNFKFDNQFEIGDTTKQNTTEVYALQFKTVFYSFTKQDKKIRIVKQRINKDNQSRIDLIHTYNLKDARKIWINLTKGRKVNTIKYTYYHE